MTVHPTLAAVLAALDESGYWATAFDTRWRIVAESAEQIALTQGEWINGNFHYGPDGEAWRSGSVELLRDSVRRMGAWMLQDLGVDRDGLRKMLDPTLRDVVDELEPCDSDAVALASPTLYSGSRVGLAMAAMRVRDPGGQVVGTMYLTKPRVGMSTIAMLTASGDLDHLQRMHDLAVTHRRPAAVLFADLEGSAQLSKRLSTASYFALIRRITRAADECVIDEGGLVGRHIGDGFAAFFVAEAAGSESAAARSCLAAARALQASMLQVADRHDLPAGDVTVRAGLHWGTELHIGSIITRGRAEVTALGDEVNEAARIESCATGGRMLASKDLIEQLEPADAEALGLDRTRITYTRLTDLTTATDKARRDAPAISVCDIAPLLETDPSHHLPPS